MARPDYTYYCATPTSHATRCNMNRIVRWNETVELFGDERLEEIWLLVYPDGADTEEILDMAKDPEQMQWLEETYTKIVNLYMSGELDTLEA